MIDIHTQPVHPTPDDLVPVDNLLTFPCKRFGPVEIAKWFLRLGAHLWKDEVDITPTAFLLVLINDDDVRVYRGGDNTLFDDARIATEDHDKHLRYLDWYDDPQEARDKRKARMCQEAIDAQLKHSHKRSR